MKHGFRVMDSDLHLFEPYDLWDRYLEPEWRSQAPKFSETEGGPFRFPKIEVAGVTIPDEGYRTTASPVESLQKDVWTKGSHYASAFERDFDAESTVEAMDIEGIDVGVIYPTQGRQVVAHDEIEPGLAAALCRAYNRWVADFCATAPDRLKYAAMVPFHSPELAAEETERSVEEHGAVAIVGSPTPVGGRHIHDADFDVLWGTCARLNIPVGFHPTGITSLRDNFMRRFYGHPNAHAVGASIRNPVELMSAIASMTLGGVFERHDNLRAAFLEGTAGWIPWLLWRLDEKFESYGVRSEVALSRSPSELFFERCFVAPDIDEPGIARIVDAIGDDTLVVSTDYPHWDGPFPEGVSGFLEIEGLSDESRRKILWDNCARLYNLEAAVPLPA